jgi:DNA-binding response OmpR family regulator
MTRLLIVDDEERHRRTLDLALHAAGFDTLTAASAEEALVVLKKSDGVDLALVDLMLPGMSGLDLARQMRVLHPGVRVVLLSAYHLSGSQVERSDCGAVGFVPKPYRIDELVDFLRGKTRKSPRKSPPPEGESV